MTFCIDRAGIVGEDGATHHGALDLAYLRTIQGMTIAAPSTASQLRGLMRTASELDGPMAIRYPRGSAVQETGSICQNAPEAMEIGRGRKLRDGSQIVFMSIGPIAAEVAKAIDSLNAEGISAAHYDMIFLKPIDDEMMKEVAEKDCPIVTVEDGSRNGGLGSAVEDWLQDNGYVRTVKRLGVPDKFIPQGSPKELQHLCSFDSEAILEAINEVTAK